MKIVLSWLAQFMDLHDLSPQELAHRLTLTGLAVDAVHELGSGFNHIVVGRLLKVLPHPNADKLSLTEVEIPGHVLSIVCGAKNIAPGDVVPVALEGAKLPNGLEIKPTKIRGVLSNGMLCSGRELGLSEDHAGILQLPQTAPLGMPVAEFLQLKDTILEVDITPNRADCLSHLGVARHLGAVLNRSWQMPDTTIIEKGPAAASLVQVKIEPHSGCQRYCARIVQNVKNGPSPDWLRQRLQKAGMRSISLLVDITNYVLLEIGHPLHAFDLARLQGGLIQARRARPGESLVTLDNQERLLSSGELVIADAKRPVALAGVMGGLSSEVTSATKDILLEAAWFEPMEIRRTVRQTGCRSESSFRFERGTDPDATLVLALNRAAHLLAELAGGVVLPGIVEGISLPWKARSISLRLARAEKILGMPLKNDTVCSALSRLGFDVQTQPGGRLDVTVPGFRQDVALEEDLVEEIAEVFGYDQIPVRTPRVLMSNPEINPNRDFAETCRDLSAGLGLTETVTYSFFNPAWLDRWHLPKIHAWRNSLVLRNPISEETSHLRPTLMAGLLEVLMHNQRRGIERIYLFEMGSVFIPRNNDELPDEPKRLGILLSGLRSPLHWQGDKKNPNADFYDLKGILDGLSDRLHFSDTHFSFTPGDQPFLHPAVNFTLQMPDGSSTGWAGLLHPEIQESLKIKEPVLLAELDMAVLARYWRQAPALRSFSRYPASSRDMALAVDDHVRAGDVMDAIKRAGGEQLIRIIPFDVYRGENVAPGTKSLAFSLTFQASDRTLQDEEVQALQEEILSQVQTQFGARQR